MATLSSKLRIVLGISNTIYSDETVSDSYNVIKVFVIWTWYFVSTYSITFFWVILYSRTLIEFCYIAWNDPNLSSQNKQNQVASNQHSKQSKWGHWIIQASLIPLQEFVFVFRCNSVVRFLFTTLSVIYIIHIRTLFFMKDMPASNT